MLLEDHKQLSRRAIQLWNSNSPDKPEDIVSENYVNHQQPDVEGGIRARDLEAWKELISGFTQHGLMRTSVSRGRSQRAI